MSQHRPSSTTPMNVPGRHAGARSHTHSMSLGALNPAHRVTRRKSMTSNNFAAMAAAVQGIDEASLEAMVSPGNKVFSPKSGNGARRSESSSTARPGTSVPSSVAAMLGEEHEPADAAASSSSSSALDDGEVLNENGSASSKLKNRRGSEGSHLTKAEGKRASGELRCEKCGKGYKHSSCLTKHL